MNSVNSGGGLASDIVKMVTVVPLYIFASIFLILAIIGIITRLYIGNKYMEVTAVVASDIYMKNDKKIVNISYYIDDVEYFRSIPVFEKDIKIGQNIKILVDPANYNNIINVDSFYSSVGEVLIVSIILFALAGGLSWLLTSM